MFSVVIPLYNKEYSVVRCVDSVLAQSFKNFEIIIVNDGSTDSSLCLVLERYSKEIENGLIKLLNQNNQGVSAARNNGIESACYDFICLLDADDEWHPSFLSAIRELILDFPKASIYSLAHFVKKDNLEIKKAKYGLPEGFRGYVDDFFLRSTKGFVVKSSNVCVLKSSILDIGGFPVGVAAGEDLIVWILLALRYRVVCGVNYLVTVHQQTDNSRGARKNIVPYPFVYFSKKKKPENSKSLNKYLLYIFLHHAKRSLLEKNIKQIFVLFYYFIISY